MDWKKIAILAVVTAVEGALATWVAMGYKTDKVAVGAAVGAGASAAYNIVRQYLLERK